MLTGIVIPTGRAQRLELDVLARVRDETGVQAIRWDCHVDNPWNDHNVQRIRQAGFLPWPILDGDRHAWMSAASVGAPELALWPYLSWLDTFCAAHRFQAVEVLNEPHILDPRLTPEQYAILANAAGDHIRLASPQTQVYLAGEMLRPDRKGPKKEKWWGQCRAGLIDSLYDGVAIHPYREPGPPEVARIGGFSFWSWGGGTRETEMEWCRQQAPGHDVAVTEVGWRVGPAGGITEAEQADYLIRELGILAELNVSAVFLYAHHADPARDFGLLRNDWSPRPAAHAVREWIAGQ